MLFLEMGLCRSRIEFLVMFEVVQHSLFIMKTPHKSDELKILKKRGGGGGGGVHKSGTYGSCQYSYIDTNNRGFFFQFNSNILLNKCINTISNGIAHQA